MRHVFIACSALSILFFLMIVACTPRQTPLNIAVSPYIGFQPLFFAEQAPACQDCPTSAHYIDGQAFTLNLVASMNVVSRLFYTEQLDAAVMSLEKALELHSYSNNGVCIARVLGSARGSRGILTRAGFDNKQQPSTFGYEQWPFNNYMLGQAASALQWDTGAMEFQYISIKDQMAALQAGKIDAVLAVEPYLTYLTNMGAELVYSDKALAEQSVDVFVVTLPAYEAHQSLIKWLAHTYWPHGVEQLQTAGSGLMQEMAENMGVPINAAYEAMQKIPYLNGENSTDFMFDLESLVEEALTRMPDTQLTTPLQYCEQELKGA